MLVFLVQSCTNRCTSKVEVQPISNRIIYSCTFGIIRDVLDVIQDPSVARWIYRLGLCISEYFRLDNVALLFYTISHAFLAHRRRFKLNS